MATWFDTRDQRSLVHVLPGAVTPARTVRLALYAREAGVDPQRRGLYLGSLELDVSDLRRVLSTIEAAT